MQPEILDILCDPQTHQPLTLDRGCNPERLIASNGKGRYDVEQGMGVFIRQEQVTGSNIRP